MSTFRKHFTIDTVGRHTFNNVDAIDVTDIVTDAGMVREFHSYRGDDSYSGAHRTVRRFYGTGGRHAATVRNVSDHAPMSSHRAACYVGPHRAMTGTDHWSLGFVIARSAA